MYFAALVFAKQRKSKKYPSDVRNIKSGKIMKVSKENCLQQVELMQVINRTKLGVQRSDRPISV